MLSTFRQSALRSACLIRSMSTTTTGFPQSQSDPLLREAVSLLHNPIQQSPRIPKAPATPEPSKPISAPVYEIPPDKDPVLQFLTTSVMKHGRYQRAQKIISEMLLHIHAFTRTPPLPIVHEAIRRASPAVRVKFSKVGARSITRPVALSERQRTAQGIRWILEASKNKPGIHMQLRLAKEMISVVKGDSSALEKKSALHRAAMLARGTLSKR
ncbi:ribosomal protein S7 [Coprinopsis marcescibilis]|uniref:Ribosomal protein S7 n=1 Tax=Coprinopsis marcescibilis TaxID=230819 RepID=A0A5C3L8V6_COPMA|nr:ribosomal protein S7 [Coprinopsis marcescibilis]